MARYYVHLSGKDTDGAIFRLNGIDVKQDNTEMSRLKPRKCQQCDTLNGHDSSFCRKCGSALDLAPALQADEQTQQKEKLMSSVLRDEAVQQAVLKAVAKLKLQAEPKVL